MLIGWRRGSANYENYEIGEFLFHFIAECRVYANHTADAYERNKIKDESLRSSIWQNVCNLFSIACLSAILEAYSNSSRFLFPDTELWLVVLIVSILLVHCLCIRNSICNQKQSFLLRSACNFSFVCVCCWQNGNKLSLFSPTFE